MITILTIITFILALVGFCITFKSVFDKNKRGIVAGMFLLLISPTPIIGKYYYDSLEPILKTEYEIELINQDSIKIYNGSVLDTIPFNKLEEYIESDNL